MCRVFYIVDSAEKVGLTINDVWTEYMAKGYGYTQNISLRISAASLLGRSG